jgi:hypothetical protein
MASKNEVPAESTEPEVVVPAAADVTVDDVSPESAHETVVDSATTPPPPQVIVVDAPVRPKKKGNRVAGILFSLVATLIFAVLFSIAYVVTQLVVGAGFSFAFASSADFVFPIVFFFVGMVLIVLILNRAGWWSHIFGSVIVGLIVLFGTASLVLVSAGMLSMTQQQANGVFYSALLQPTTIVAALLAREVAIWTGAVIARRGRKVKARNVEAAAQFEREQAELIPTS